MKLAHKPQKEKKVVDNLDKVEHGLQNLEPEHYPDYTADWPKEELKSKLLKSIQSGESDIHSAEDFFKVYPSRKNQ